MNSYMHQYRDNQIQTASPEQILIMLYDGAIHFCRQAMEAEEKVVQAEKISRTMAIVCEFSNSLDHGIGGRIAAELDALYGFMIRELTRANLEGDARALETVENLLTGLRDTWIETAGIYTKERQMLCKKTGSRIAAAL